jgi:LPS export ABC transporter protein LptC
MPRLILIGIALALGAGLAYLVFVRELPRTEEQVSALPQQTLDMTNVVMRQQRGDTLEWVITSAHAIYNETLHQAELHPVQFQVLNSGGKNPHPVDLQGTADAAYLDQTSQRVTLRGSSHIVKDKKLELNSDVLEYQHAAGTLKATGNVEVHDRGALIQANAAEYTIATEKLILTAPRLYQ